MIALVIAQAKFNVLKGLLGHLLPQLPSTGKPIEKAYGAYEQTSNEFASGEVEML